MDDGYRKYLKRYQKPANFRVANTAPLNRSEIGLSLRQACGFNPDDDVSPPSVTSMLCKREIGPNFSQQDEARIVSGFVPVCMKRVIKCKSKLFCGTFNEDGKFFLTTSHDKFVRLYRYNNGNLTEYKKYSASAVGYSIIDTAFSPDGNYFVYSSWSYYLYMHSIHGDPKHREALPLNANYLTCGIFSVVFSNDGRELYCGGNDGCLYIYDRETRNCSKIQGHANDVNSVRFADDTCQILLSGADDGLCKVWDRRILREDNPQPAGVLAGHKGGITYIDPRGDGKHLITNSKDQTIKLWDARVFSSREAQEESHQEVSMLNTYWDYTHQRVPRLLLHPTTPLDGDTSIMTYRGHLVIFTLVRCHFSPAATTGQRFIYTGCGKGNVIVYDVLTGRVRKTLSGHTAVTRDVSWHPTQHEILSTSWDGTVACWRYE